ncbi:hypothetical protein Q7Q91_08960 [Lactiplantibacillus pentosus]|uniref:hypothetical protein n=1 Tax=Lactiplantibacillus pentosus TaxID=1589 RepID=UPI002702092C|nr:hypothetical protein [Lactiplantibacillus pentosus]MDO7805108.1 hypothetical protein [Lactiplantibacillus pentosus]
MIKHQLINILTAELSALPVLILAYYAITAKPTGEWQLVLTPAVYWLASSYLISYPLLLATVPILRHNHLKMQSISVQASLKYHSHLNERAARWDDEMNLAIFILERGVLMLLSEPVGLLLLLYFGIRRLQHDAKRKTP